MSKNDQSKGTCPFNHHVSFQPSNTFVPDFDIPLLAPGGGGNDCDQLFNLGPLKRLIGTWVSDRYSGYNVMPIPQATAPNGFIVKNFYYYEVITFSAISGKVANRGGTDEQDSYTLFYEQRVFFSDGIQKDQLVHAENGSWSHLITGPQGQGPLNIKPHIPTPPAPSPIPAQPHATSIVKQISVPHGNSILALGSSHTIDGAPTIHDVNALPINTPNEFHCVYGTNITTNPNVNTNIVLQDALNQNTCNNPIIKTHIIEVDSSSDGQVSNIPFIKKHADVINYTNTFWLEEFANGSLKLQYSQNISLSFPKINPKTKGEEYIFPHVTANTLYKVK